MIPEPTPMFVGAVQRSLAYWRNQLSQCRLTPHEWHLLGKTLRIAAKLPSTWAQTAELALIASRTLNRWGLWVYWEGVLQTVIDQTPPSGLPLKSKLLVQLGHVQIHRGAPQAAEAAYLAGQGLAQSQGDPQILAECEYGLGLALFGRHAYVAAEAHATRALAYIDRLPIPDSVLKARSLQQMAAIYLARGDANSAATYSQAAVALRREIGDVPDLIGELVNLARAEQAKPNYYAMAKALIEAEGLLQHLPPRPDLYAAVYLTHAENFISIGQPDEGLRMVSKIDLRALQAAGELQMLGQTLNNLGHIQLARGQLALAVEALKQAAGCWQTLDQPLMQANSLTALGEAYLLQGKTSQARRIYKTALALLAGLDEDALAQRLAAHLNENLN